VWPALVVALLLVATAEGAALVVLVLIVRDMQREFVRRTGPPTKRSARPVGFRLPEQAGEQRGH
jgi:hypothetical protein